MKIHSSAPMFTFKLVCSQKLNANAERVANSALKRGEAKDRNWDDYLRDVVNERMQQAGAESGKPIEMLGRMMPRVGPPEDCEAMLASMDPINREIDYQNSEPDPHHEREFFQVGGNRGNPADMTARASGNQAGANPIGHNGEDKREHVQF